MKDFESRWENLVRAARQAPVSEDVTIPYGFATRVAARALAGESRPVWLAVCGRFSARALWVARLLVVASAAANYLAFAGGEDEEQSLLDPVSEVLSNS